MASSIALIAEGQLIRHATPESLLHDLDGRVWEWVVESDQIEAVRQKWLVTGTVRRADGVHVRILSAPPPSLDARPLPPALEDVYLEAVGAHREAHIAAWLWPLLLLWSNMGVRESQHRTGPLIFSCTRPVRRQFVALWLSGVLIAAATGSGLAARFMLDGDMVSLSAWVVGALFVPSLALALGVWTESSRAFEALYTAWWYLGPANKFTPLDFSSAWATASGVSRTPLEEYKASGARIRGNLRNYPWAYEMLVEDPDGHVLRFGSEPRTDMPFTNERVEL